MEGKVKRTFDKMLNLSVFQHFGQQRNIISYIFTNEYKTVIKNIGIRVCLIHRDNLNFHLVKNNFV